MVHSPSDHKAAEETIVPHARNKTPQSTVIILLRVSENSKKLVMKKHRAGVPFSHENNSAAKPGEYWLEFPSPSRTTKKTNSHL